MTLLQLITIPFAFYAFLGWMMETLYATQKQHEFVNRGFLKGPFCPIYGLGGLLVEQVFIRLEQVSSSTLTTTLGGILFSIILVTLLEYATGSVLENIFQKKWWDYSQEPFNLHGYICLRFSVLWGFLAYAFMQAIQPIFNQLTAQIMPQSWESVTLLLLAYFIIDTSKTIADLVDLRRVIFQHAEYPLDFYINKLMEHKRFFRAFPSLRQLNNQVKNREIRRIFDEKINNLKSEIKNRRSL
ncbi:putative ABC transporter permease [Gottschalkiaceae bacterium SANA]|nr:putative ABC transporter permease [Gottschalkiaceae bacterium SANA]